MDRFINTLKSYDNNLYIDQTRPYAFTSHYNDYSYGGNFEASTEMFNKHLLKIAAHFKNDTHRENNEGEPNREFTDYTYSYGIEDVYSPIPSIKIVPGVSFNLRNSIKAEDYNSSSEEITNFPINKNSALNAQLLLDYAFNQNFDITLTAAHKTRFATMKDRYSYKMGLAIPNPELKAEQAMNLELASIMKLSDRITFEPALFYTRLFNTIQMIDNVLPGISQQQNTGGAQFWGADFAFSYQFLQNLKWSSNYSFIKRENISSPELKFTDVPEHKIFSYIDYSPIKNMDFVFSAGYNSYRYSTSFGTKSPEFLVFNSQISYSFAKFFRAEVGINNLLDKNYTLAEGYPQEGRNIYVSLILNIIK